MRLHTSFCFGFGTALFMITLGASLAAEPELPRVYLDTTYVPPSGREIAVAAGADFQAALDAAQPGDVITLEAGAVFPGPFRLPNKSGSAWIVIRTSAPDRSLPSPGTRVDPSFANVMPKLVAASGSVITTASGAHHYRFMGIEIRPRQISDSPSSGILNLMLEAIKRVTSSARKGVFQTNLVQLGTAAETTVDQLPHHIIFDRCYLHGDPNEGTRRGIAMNGKSIAVFDSYLSDFKEVGADSQAIGGWNGPGPFKIVNNYLEAAGENVMFGGGDPSIAGLVPSDIEIRHNHFGKPLSWRIEDPSYAGTPWTVKNLFELKNARRVLIEGNLFEYNWAHAQHGFAILFTVRNQYGRAPWSVVEDVTFINNIVRHTARGMNLHGFDDKHPSQQSRRILIKNNLFEDVDTGRWGGGCCKGWLQIANGTAEVVVDHNTAFHSDNVLTASGKPNPGFIYRNNITPHNANGIRGHETGVGHPTLTTYFPGAIVEKNVIAAGDPTRYPPDNFFPASLEAVGFADRTGANSRLAATSPYKRAGTDGKDLGADSDALASALAAMPSRPAHRPNQRAH
jgi:hypothetical protein